MLASQNDANAEVPEMRRNFLDVLVFELAKLATESRCVVNMAQEELRDRSFGDQPLEHLFVIAHALLQIIAALFDRTAYGCERLLVEATKIRRNVLRRRSQAIVDI